MGFIEIIKRFGLAGVGVFFLYLASTNHDTDGKKLMYKLAVACFAFWIGVLAAIYTG